MNSGTKFEKPVYPSYNGLGRTALIAGVLPLIPTIIVGVIAVLGALVLQGVMGPAGLLFVLLAIPVLLFLKSICETDDQAMGMLSKEIMCWFQTKTGNGHLWNNTYTLTPVKYGRQLHVYQRPFEKPTRD